MKLTCHKGLIEVTGCLVLVVSVIWMSKKQAHRNFGLWFFRLTTVTTA